MSRGLMTMVCQLQLETLQAVSHPFGAPMKPLKDEHTCEQHRRQDRAVTSTSAR
jgi:hypothetical protein